jgi:photosystem II stability/assembly factor-like uncharacterized protein
MAAAPKVNPPSYADVRPGGLRSLLILLSILTLLGASWLAWEQAPRGDPLHPPQGWTNWNWWLNPIVENGIQELNYVSTRALFSVFFLPDGRHGWTAGYDGAIAATTDGGRTWKLQSTRTTNRLEGVCFVDPLQGWAVGWAEGDVGIILVTLDGGATWNPQGPTAPPRLHSVHFVDATHGWATGDQGSVLRTSNGGKTWEATKLGPGKNLHSIYFTDTVRGWAVGDDGAIFRTLDGGTNWAGPQNPTSQALFTVHFVDAQHGWAVGNGGTIVATIDGGENWGKQTSPTLANLIAIRFADSRHGWAVGSNDTLIATDDGGRTWKVELSDSTDNELEDVYFTSAQRGWVVGSAGIILATNDGGSTWRSQTSPSPPWLQAVHFADPAHGWVVGDGGVILATVNGGQSWISQPSATTDRLQAVYFVDSQRGWVVGDRGAIRGTSDGGRTWVAQKGNTPQAIHAVFFIDAQLGWAVGDGGTIVTTRDAGVTWQAVSPPTTESLHVIRFIDTQHGWAATASGTLFVSDDGGKTWVPHKQPTPPGGLIGIHYAAPGHGWGVGAGGAIFALRSDLDHWEAQQSHVQQMLFAIQFIDTQHGWAVGEGGTIVMTTDGGMTWRKPQSVPTRQVLIAVHFRTLQQGWAVGNQGTIIATTDGGVTWNAVPLNHDVGAKVGEPSLWFFTDPSHAGWLGQSARYLTEDGGSHWSAAGSYKRYFAPWWWLAALAALALAAVAAAIDPGSIRQPSSIEGALSHDSPITSKDQDQLGYARIADGLAGFITNSRTSPPLSISITGPWGQGKSSIMELLRRQLESWKFPVVWFNAWHHQKSEEILASLFAHIREQALPKWLTPRGWAFRLRLAGTRLARRPALSIVSMLVLSFLVSLLWSNPAKLAALARDAELEMHLLSPASPADTSTKIDVAAQSPGEAASSTAGKNASEQPALSIPTKVGAILAAILALGALFTRLFRAFGVSTSSLLPRISNVLRPASLLSPPAARYRFASDFGDVCAAYGVRRLVVFIDDIDRCEPSIVPEVLGLVNFLMMSGRCFIVLGAEKTWVLAAIANAYKDISPTVIEYGQDGEEGSVKDFARRYLEKLLNLEVPVTASGDNVVRAMLEERKVRREAEPKRFDLKRITAFVREIWPVTVIALLIAAAAWLGVVVGNSQPTPQNTPATARAPTSTVSTPGCALGPQSDPICRSGTKLTADSNTTGAASDTWSIQAMPDQTRFPWFRVVAGLVFLTLLAVLAMLRVPLFVREDSPNFQKALEVWADWLSERHRTPRSFKRFVNKVRFIAMLQRGDAANVESLRARIRKYWSRTRLAEPADDQDLSSPAIVAYAAILTRQNRWQFDVLKDAFPLDGSVADSEVLQDRFETSRSESFAAVHEQLRASVSQHRQQPSFQAASSLDAWLPEPKLRKLIEALLLPEAVHTKPSG